MKELFKTLIIDKLLTGCQKMASCCGEFVYFFVKLSFCNHRAVSLFFGI